MGDPPAVIIVVRHGSRLDAADKQWHLNSPTPYDPPLTYGGWTQCRSLGIRIANLLHDLPSQSSQHSHPSTSPSHERTEPHMDQSPKRKRKQRVVIHSSPFLRCIQTSIALASGLAATPMPTPHAPSEHTGSLARRAVTMPQFSHSAARSSSRNRLDSPMLAPLPEAPSPGPSPITSNPPTFPSSDSPAAHNDTHAVATPIQKAILRVDAFLGEWLSPDYFEQITPPPSSVMMVAAAKADLLRREDYGHLNTGSYVGGRNPSLSPPTSGFPGGWGSPSLASLASRVTESVTSADAEEELPGPAMPLPKRDRTSSMSSVGSSNSSKLSGHPTIRPNPSHSNIPMAPGSTATYHPPIPHYAISTSDPIPPGYVAHSKEACVDVDYQWDSMREPQNWGDGGEYGEEWSSMHKRFRRGLKSMVEWYKTHDANIHRSSSNPTSRSNSRPGSGYGSGSRDTTEGGEEAEEEEVVVILVTHGAGCNALIGALTNQPALLDVGMANLTMAVRRPPYVALAPTHLSPNGSRANTPHTTPRPTPMHSRSSSRVLTLSDEYELKLLNSSEHLRRSSTTSTTSSFSSNLPSLPTRPFLNRPYTVTSGSDSDQFSTQNPFVDPAHLGHTSGSPTDSAGRASYAGSYAGIGSSISDLLPGSAGLRRTVSVASGSGSSAGGRTYTPRFKGSVGLWSPRKPSSHEDDHKEEEGVKEDTRGDDMVLNFAEEREARETHTSTLTAINFATDKDITHPFSKMKIPDDNTKPEPQTTPSRRPQTSSGDGSSDRIGTRDIKDGVGIETPSPSQGGGLWSEKKTELWSERKTEKKPEEAGMIPKRAEGPKRRWTLTEKGMVVEHGLDRV